VLALMIATPVGATQIIGGDLIGGSTILGLDTGQALPDWSSLLSAVWYFEETSTALLDSGENSNDDFDDWQGGVTTQTGTVFEGARSGDVGTGGVDLFVCNNTDCPDLDFTDGDVEGQWGCRVWRGGTSASATGFFRKYHFSQPLAGGSGWRSNIQGSGATPAHEAKCQMDRPNCGTQPCGDITIVSNESVPFEAWEMVDCHLNDSDNDTNGVLHVYQDGALNASTSEFTGGAFAVSATTDAAIGPDNSVYGIRYFDECYFDKNYEWVAADFCRKCSCGIKGEFCRCDASTPANFHTCSSNDDCGGAPAICSAGGTCAGYHNSAQCDNCTLTACNKANPG